MSFICPAIVTAEEDVKCKICDELIAAKKQLVLM
jgi:hypothetical protein